MPHDMNVYDFHIQKIYQLQPGSNPEPRAYEPGTLHLSHRSSPYGVFRRTHDSLTCLLSYRGQKKKSANGPQCSQHVTLPCTDRIRRCLTLVIG
ncbi:hypothetical protein TNCV_468651 [Trichonephila clavipes]|nr:hypothetical protein TNCV_468651 [Trichonephila clavipes]